MLNYGIVGNCKSCALISKKGDIEWFCFPTFSSPSVFGKILDRNNGGSFEISTFGNVEYNVRQVYIKDTNILETYYESDKSSFVIVDFFPRYRKILPNKRTKILSKNYLMRIIKPIDGKPFIKVKYDPKLNYAKGENFFRIVKENLVTKNGNFKIGLISNVDYDVITNGLYFKLDEPKYFVIGEPGNYRDFDVKRCLHLMKATKQYWNKWVSTLVLPERNRDLIVRSALVLKLLTFSETGAIIAAATTSIPEEVGSVRTWDYRFCWVRDASYTVDALKKIGRDYEAKKLMEFIFKNTIEKKQNIQIMYGINGETKLTEKKLEHLCGFENSKPVRVGNSAYYQNQHDIYGNLVDILYHYYVFYEYEKKMPVKFWNFLKYIVKEIRILWDLKDKGIWEFRGHRKHFTYSKLMCYVGFDRAVKIAEHYGKNNLVCKWAKYRDKIREDILKNGWNKKINSFTMYYGSDKIDASLLMMVYYDFLPTDDPRIVSTVDRIKSDLRTGPLVQRYKIKDDFGFSNSAFTICAFWLVDALYNVGEVKEANEIFEKLVKYSNHVGLFSEDLDLKSGKMIGNFPQAYTHIAMINSSILLSEWSSKRKKIDFVTLPRHKRKLG